jgi:dTDP-4-amino-4,6-dideoxygalactose transaminase
MAICAEHDVPLLEDAAESLGATYQGRMTGTLGRMGVYSFNGNKIITTSGGGMLVSAEKELTDKAYFLATQARDPARHYQHSQIGYNYRMSNVVAGIGRGQLLHLDEHIRLKKKIYHQYKEAFADLSALTMNPLNKEGEANNWLSCLTVAEDYPVKPEQIMDALEAENIECRPIWKPMHLQPVYAGYDYFSHEEGKDVAAQIFAHGLCLPSDIKNTAEDMERIVSLVRKRISDV